MDLTREVPIIAILRQDGRIGLTQLSRKTGMPVSTIFDRLRANSVITRYTGLLDFGRLGFGCRAMILLRTTKEDKTGLGEYLKKHPYVNSLHKINNSLDFCLEGVFKDLAHIETFIESLEEKFKIRSKQVHYLLEEMKREGFLTDQQNARTTLEGRAGY